MKLITGLGNPGKKYDSTRHNLGFMVIDRLAELFQINVTEKKFKAFFGKGNMQGNSVLLVKPQTFMNLSGEAVTPLANYFKIPVNEIIVIADDLNIDFGRIRIRKTGSDGGHNGLKSIIQTQGSKDFIRVRMGIGLPANACDVSNYVLSEFNSNEKNELDQFIDKGGDAVVSIVTQSVDQAMNQFNS